MAKKNNIEMFSSALVLETKEKIKLAKNKIDFAFPW